MSSPALSVVLAGSWYRHRSLLLPAWAGAAVVCVAAAIAGEGLHYYVDFRDGGGRFRGLMSLASGFCLVAFGWSLLERSAFAASRSERLAWVTAGLLGVWLAFDEVAQFHEAVSHLLARRGVPAPPGLDHDLYVFALYGLLAVFLIGRLRSPLRRSSDVLLPALVAAACLVLSQAFDVLPWAALSHETQQWVGAGEEALKCLGSWNLALVGLVLSRTTPRP